LSEQSSCASINPLACSSILRIPESHPPAYQSPRVPTNSPFHPQQTVQSALRILGFTPWFHLVHEPVGTDCPRLFHPLLLTSALPTIPNSAITDSTRYPMSQQAAPTRSPGQVETSSAAVKTGESQDCETVGSRRKGFWLIESLINIAGVDYD
jgi:hypothetical protein